jgi:hypothetical protein
MHNTAEQNEAFRKAFDATNIRWKLAVAYDNLTALENARQSAFEAGDWDKVDYLGCCIDDTQDTINKLKRS